MSTPPEINGRSETMMFKKLSADSITNDANYKNSSKAERLTPELTRREELREAFSLADDIHADSARVE